MIRYRILHPIALAMSWLAMRIDCPWLFEKGGALEYYADQCASGER